MAATRKFFTLSEIASQVNLSQGRIRYLCKQGIIKPHFYIGKLKRYDLKEVVDSIVAASNHVASGRTVAESKPLDAKPQQEVQITVPLLSPEEACDLLGVDRSVFDRLIEYGHLTSTAQVGDRHYYNPYDVREVLDPYHQRLATKELTLRRRKSFGGKR